MKLWIRVDAASPDDPRIMQLGAELRVPDAQAFGLCVAVWCRMAEHATTGSLADVPSSLLERWAGWRGKAGRFAAAFLAAFVADDGKVRGWEDRQGALLTRMERDRQRHRKPGEPSRNNGESSTEIPGNLRGGLHGDSPSTERNGTEQRSTPPPPPLRARDSNPKYLEVRGQLAPEFHADLDRLLDLVPEASAWCAAIAARLPTGAMHGKPHDPAHVGEGIRQFLMAGRAVNAKPIQFWRYVETAAEPPAGPAPPAAANGNGRPGPPPPRNQAAPAKSYEYTPTESEDQAKWQD
jgi:hypothetical protein